MSLPKPVAIAVAVMTMTDLEDRTSYVINIVGDSLVDPMTLEQLGSTVAYLSATIATMAHLVDTLREVPTFAPLVEAWLRELGLRAAREATDD